MKRPMFFSVFLIALLVMAFVAPPAAARHHYRHSRGWGGPYYGPWPYYGQWPFSPRFYEPPFYGPLYGPYYRPDPPVIVIQPQQPPPAQPPYVQKPEQALPQQQSQPNVWYWCNDPQGQGYWPYIQKCEGPWMQVLPQPAPPSVAPRQ